jgi:hypothetical protein
MNLNESHRDHLGTENAQYMQMIMTALIPNTYGRSVSVYSDGDINGIIEFKHDWIEGSQARTVTTKIVVSTR